MGFGLALAFGLGLALAFGLELPFFLGEYSSESSSSDGSSSSSSDGGSSSISSSSPLDAALVFGCAFGVGFFGGALATALPFFFGVSSSSSSIKI